MPLKPLQTHSDTYRYPRSGRHVDRSSGHHTFDAREWVLPDGAHITLSAPESSELSGTVQIAPVSSDVEGGQRIIKNELFSTHLSSTAPTGYRATAVNYQPIPVSETVEIQHYTWRDADGEPFDATTTNTPLPNTNDGDYSTAAGGWRADLRLWLPEYYVGLATAATPVVYGTDWDMYEFNFMNDDPAVRLTQTPRDGTALTTGEDLRNTSIRYNSLDGGKTYWVYDGGMGWLLSAFYSTGRLVTPYPVHNQYIDLITFTVQATATNPGPWRAGFAQLSTEDWGVLQVNGKTLISHYQMAEYTREYQVMPSVRVMLKDGDKISMIRFAQSESEGDFGFRMQPGFQFVTATGEPSVYLDGVDPQDVAIPH